MSEIDDKLRVEYRGRDVYIVTECPECGGKAQSSVSGRNLSELPTTLRCSECAELTKGVVRVERKEITDNA